MIDRKRVSLFACVVVALASCSSLPDYAAPQARVMDPKLVDASDLIAYRTLERADFKADRPPREFSAYSDRIGAATCAYLRFTDATQLRSRSERSSDGDVTYVITADEVRIVAWMNRNCSWWNPKDLGLPQEYILEHEQIHFAIFELEARRMNTFFASVRPELTTTSNTPQEGYAVVRAKLRDHLERQAAEIVSRSRDFDEDTSMGHSPEKQKEWWARVSDELSSTADR